MYYHGVINGLVDEKILSILKEKEINSASRRKSTNSIGFNENDYISLCKYLGEETYKEHENNAFHKYILNNFCFIISEDLEVETPIFIENASTMNRFELMNMRIRNPNKRFSDMIDERQVYYVIPLEKIVAIGIPYNKKPVVGNLIKLSSFTYFTPDEYLDFIGKIESMAADLNIPIVDSSDPNFALVFEEKSKTK